MVCKIFFLILSEDLQTRYLFARIFMAVDACEAAFEEIAEPFCRPSYRIRGRDVFRTPTRGKTELSALEDE
jgi:hypothetical protein